MEMKTVPLYKPAVKLKVSKSIVSIDFTRIDPMEKHVACS